MGTTLGNWESIDMSQVLPPRAELNRCSLGGGGRCVGKHTRCQSGFEGLAGGTCREGKVLPLGCEVQTPRLFRFDARCQAPRRGFGVRLGVAGRPWRGPRGYGQFELG